MKKQRVVLVMLLLLVGHTLCSATDPYSYVSFKREKGYFPLIERSVPVPCLVSPNENVGVLKAFENFLNDVERVCGTKPKDPDSIPPYSASFLVAGTLGSNAFIDGLVTSGKLDVSSIKGKWEGFLIKVIDNPTPGVKRVLVIAGSDRRGTIFGLYDLAQQIGVSPWYWWADVPVREHSEVFVSNTPQIKIPSVKYRGIFINDEQPALGGWAAKNFGGFNHKFYEKVFELILRMKGNFLWPAMWGQSFYSDDPLSPKLADEYGVVIGTSHHEPMMRAHVEWQRNGGGPWNYQTNELALQKFWRDGITRMASYESIVTLAMRGDGDEPMSEESNVKLLERIVDDQRRIIEEVTKKNIAETPQVWALYKEVQDYYDKGMRVPDDVTLLLCDDNWGNIRKLPAVGEKKRKGGYGIYYHFDYVGDPRNYKWLNTNPIARIWEQMNLAWEYGAKQMWIVNVGDIKPMEFPIEFFLDMAFSPEAIKADQLDAYTIRWATRVFGEAGKEIAPLLTTYTRFNGRRKPELLAPDSFSPNLYSLANYREAEKVVDEYNALSERAKAVYEKLPSQYRDAYYQLVLYPIEACANINEFYFTVRLNHLYALQKRAATNKLADKATALFERDQQLARFYNDSLSHGKWKHMMDQSKIGYVNWHDNFGKDRIPELKRIVIEETASPAVATEGSEKTWPESQDNLELPLMDDINNQQRYIEIFNRGSNSFDYNIRSTSPFIVIDQPKGTITDQRRIYVRVNWSGVPIGTHEPEIIISFSTGEGVSLKLKAFRRADTERSRGFHEEDGYISIEAEHFSKTIPAGGLQWRVLPGHGRTFSAVTTFPSNAAPTTPGKDSPYVDYEVNFKDTATVTVHAYFSPSIDFTSGNGLEYAVSFDEQPPVILNLHGANTHKDWQESVKNNIRVVTSRHRIDRPGHHILRFWRVDPGVVLQKIVIDCGGLKPSYLGPPESVFLPK
jgi:hypothetical protein